MMPFTTSEPEEVQVIEGEITTESRVISESAELLDVINNLISIGALQLSSKDFWGNETGSGIEYTEAIASITQDSETEFRKRILINYINRYDSITRPMVAIGVTPTGVFENFN